MQRSVNCGWCLFLQDFTTFTVSTTSVAELIKHSAAQLNINIKYIKLQQKLQL